MVPAIAVSPRMRRVGQAELSTGAASSTNPCFETLSWNSKFHPTTRRYRIPIADLLSLEVEE
jgi:hypothetical protein